jgi:hypothetical protein
VVIRSLTRAIRIRPQEAIEIILRAYDDANGYPDGAARRLGICRDSLHKWNRRLGIVGMIRARTGHYPGWSGPRQRQVWTTEKRPHRSRAWIAERYAL